HGLGDAAVAGPNRGLDRTRRVAHRRGVLGHRADEPARGLDLAPLPRRQLSDRDDERLDLGRVRPEALRGDVVGPLDAAEQTLAGGRHGPIFRATKADRKSTRLNSSHEWISYAVFC